MTQQFTTAQLEAWAGWGPWCAHETKWDVWDVVEIYDLNAGCDDDPIAHLYRVNPWPEGAAADAFRDDKTNAALIAAAPDLARLVLEKEKEIEKLRTAICWIEPPFIDESTSEAELRKRISFCVQDAKRAARQAMKETSDES